jgi:hypothetical protein
MLLYIYAHQHNLCTNVVFALIAQVSEDRTFSLYVTFLTTYCYTRNSPKNLTAKVDQTKRPVWTLKIILPTPVPELRILTSDMANRTLLQGRLFLFTSTSLDWRWTRAEGTWP